MSLSQATNIAALWFLTRLDLSSTALISISQLRP